MAISTLSGTGGGDISKLLQDQPTSDPPPTNPNALPPPNGETPLTQAPVWSGAGGGDQAAKVYAFQAFQKQFGRNPTQSELTMLSSAYVGADPNKANVSGGDSAVAQYFQNLTNTPDQINKKNQDKYLKEAPQHFDAVTQQFQSTLGRAPSQDELNHFGSLLASGSTDAYGLSQFLQQQPEYQTAKNEKFVGGLSGQMAANDKRQFSEQILPSIQEAYAKQGRSFDSSAFSNSATQSAQAQNTNRENFLTGLSAQQYGGVEDRAYQDYANQVAQQNALTNSGIQAQYAGVQRTQDRTNQIQDYNMQQQAYNEYLAKYGKRSNGVGGLAGGLVGAGIGAYFGGPAGGQLGYQLGSGFGNAAQNSGSY